MHIQKSSVAFYTLGCKLNYSESSTLSQQFVEAGYQVLPFDQVADHYIINTCSVTDFADKKCRQVVRRAKRNNPLAKIIVTGCYAQLKPEEIAKMDEVDLVLGASEKFNIIQHVVKLEEGSCTDIVLSSPVSDALKFHPSASFGNRTRSFLKVQDGCDYNCSFCTIPLARGKSRSDHINHVLDSIAELVQKGTKEIVLTGINLGDFGHGHRDQSLKTNETFYNLLKAIDNQGLIPRLRISSIEPNLLSDEIIELVAQSPRLMPHFHIPLQSGSNKILGHMRRRYKKELYDDRVSTIKKKCLMLVLVQM